MKKLIFLTSVALVSLLSMFEIAKSDDTPPAPPSDISTNKAPPADLSTSQQPPATPPKSDPEQPPELPTSATHTQPNGSAGYVYRSGTGSGVAAKAGVVVTTNKSDGATNGFAIDGNVVAGATKDGASQLSVVKVDGKYFWGVSDPFRTGTTTNNFVIRTGFDRDTAMDRPWAVTGGAGLEGFYAFPRSVGSGKYGYALLGEIGVGDSSRHTVPFVQVKANGNLEECYRFGTTGNHALCAVANANAALGFIQAEVGVGVGAEYRYKIAEDASGKKKTWFFVGPSGGSDLRVDVDGIHNVNQFMLSVGVK